MDGGLNLEAQGLGLSHGLLGSLQYN